MAVSIKIGDWLQAPAHAPQAAFAVGDVHGRDDLFGPLLEALEGIAFADGLPNAIVVTLGDYIDRGPDSISALNRALDGSSLVRLVCLTAVQLQGSKLRFIQAVGEAHRPWIRE
jgi:hypothetical protein